VCLMRAGSDWPRLPCDGCAVIQSRGLFFLHTFAHRPRSPSPSRSSSSFALDGSHRCIRAERSSDFVRRDATRRDAISRSGRSCLASPLGRTGREGREGRSVLKRMRSPKQASGKINSSLKWMRICNVNEVRLHQT